MPKLTPQQEAIYAAVRGDDANLVVSARAGTGKTTTSVGCLAAGATGRVGFVAFNAHIAAELRERLPANVPASTLHGLGFAAVRQAFPNVCLEENKFTNIVKRVAGAEWPSVRSAAGRVARLCKYTLADEQNDGELDAITDHYGVDLEGADKRKVYALARQCIEESARVTTLVDFDDMVWFPARFNLPVERYDLLLVDEAQDLNRAQQQLALKASAGGRLCLVGDPAQAIYGFTGADCDALPRLGDHLTCLTLRGCSSLPLTITWRCPLSHVELARQIVPDLEPAPNAIEGVVACTDLRAIAEGVRPGDLVICRKNAPVVGLTYRLITAGVPAIMRGRDIGRGLLSLIWRLKPADLDDLAERIEDFRDRELRRLERRGASASQADAVNDRCDCLGQLVSQVTSLDALQEFISSKFSDTEKPGAAVVLSSIHRSKGLEADNVWVLDPRSLPLVRRDSKPWELRQERHLAYIAATRAKQRLVFQDHVPSIFDRRVS